MTHVTAHTLSIVFPNWNEHATFSVSFKTFIGYTSLNLIWILKF